MVSLKKVYRISICSDSWENTTGWLGYQYWSPSKEVSGYMCSELWVYVQCQWVGSGWFNGLIMHQVGKGVEVQ